MSKKLAILADFAAVPPSILPRESVVREIADHVSHIHTLMGFVPGEVREAGVRGAASLARMYVALHKLKANLDLIEGSFSKVYERMKAVEVPNILEVSGMPHVPLAEGYRVGASARMWYSVRADHTEAAHNWLAGNGMKDLIKPTVNMQTLSAAVKVMIEHDQVEPPPSLFSCSVTFTTSVTATK
jgi:hypothetical protein